MIQIITGAKGKGKTKILLDKVNSEVKTSKGSVVYLDKNTKHMYELNNKVRLINVRDYCIEDANEFIGFVCGIISQDHDLEKIYLDSFLNITCIEDTDIDPTTILDKIDTISAKFNVDFIISLSVEKSQLSEKMQENVIVSL